ncbi:MAG: hypothetical protein HQK53_08955 [Oligoflexia bacterium]|nr:hypothetical protein [Oligoflexia bacterium]
MMKSTCGDAPLTNHRIQEAIWLCSEAGGANDLHKAVALRIRLYAIMCSNNFRVVPATVAGAEPKVMLEYYDPSTGPTGSTIFEGIFKWASNLVSAKAEELAYRFDWFLDLQMVPFVASRNLSLTLLQSKANAALLAELNNHPTVHSRVAAAATVGTGMGSISYWVKDAELPVPAPHPVYAPTNLHLLASTAGGVGYNAGDFVAMQLFDYVVGNPDRYNGGNFLFQNHLTTGWHNKIIAIDHGSAFQENFGGDLFGDPSLLGVIPSFATINTQLRVPGAFQHEIAGAGVRGGPSVHLFPFPLHIGTDVAITNVCPRLKAKIATITPTNVDQFLLKAGLGLTDPTYRQRVVDRYNDIKILLGKF